MYAVKNKDVIGIGTPQRRSVRNSPNQTFVFEIFSPESTIADAIKYGVEESIIKKCSSEANPEYKPYVRKARERPVRTMNASDDLNSVGEKEIEAETSIRDIFSDIDSDSDSELMNWKMDKMNKSDPVPDSSSNLVDDASDINSEEDFGISPDPTVPSDFKTPAKTALISNKTPVQSNPSTADATKEEEGEEDFLKIVCVESSVGIKTEEELLSEHDPTVGSRDSDLTSKSSAEYVEERDVKPSINILSTPQTHLELTSKKFQCRHCPKVFHKYKKYKKHLARKHDNYRVATEGGAKSLKLTVKKLKSVPGLSADTWKQSVINRSNLQCKKCAIETTFRERSGLYIHYALKHYKQEISDHFVEEDPRQCPEQGCGVRKKQEADLIAHLAVDHNYVEKIIPKKWWVQDTEQSKPDQLDEFVPNDSDKCSDTDTESPGATGATAANDSDNAQNMFENSDNVGKISLDILKCGGPNFKPNISISDRFKCEICPKVGRDRPDLLAHYSLVHFKSELQKMLGGDQTLTQCRLCGEKLKEHANLVRHYGVSHQMVHRFMSQSQLEKCSQAPKTQRPFPAQKSKSSESNRWPCQFCPRPPFSDKKSLHYHIAGVHFKDQIRALIGDTLECPECHKSYSKWNDVIRHVGSVHRYLYKFLPEFLLDTPQNSKEANNDGKPQETIMDDPKPQECRKLKRKNVPFESDEEDAEPDNDWNPHESTVKRIKLEHRDKCLKTADSYKQSSIKNSAGQLTCHICFLDNGRTFSSRAKLYQHYSVVHYKQELEYKFGLKNLKRCPECGEEKTKLVAHVGATHNQVEAFLPSKFHISSSSGRDFLTPSPSILLTPPSSSLRIQSPISPIVTPGAILSPPSSISTAGQCALESDHDTHDDEELVSEMDAELSAAWSLADKDTGDTEETQGGCDGQMTLINTFIADKSPEARVLDHSYLVKLAVSDSPSPPRVSEVTSQDQTQMMEPGIITFTENVLVTSETDI